MATSSKPMSRIGHSFPNELPRAQQLLAKHCYWDEEEQTLWIDARKLYPDIGVLEVMGWDRMMFDANLVPNYPIDWAVLQWSNYSQFSNWRKQVPAWVLDSCALFPTYQLKLLHFCGKYPQLLELLDHAPLLAWRLVSSKHLAEPEIVALLAGKRIEIVEQVGWPGKESTVKFLRNLRLRWVNAEIAEQVETCLLDENRMQALQDLPRINSMALSLAARFPHLIGSQLHRALAQLPCRPMQCKSMVALLEDAYQLGEAHAFPQAEIDRIGQCRYLSEVTDLYQDWLNTAVEVALQDEEQSMSSLVDKLAGSDNDFEELSEFNDWVQLSVLQQHAWLIDFPEKQAGEQADQVKLIAWQDEARVWAAMLALNADHQWQITRVRGLENGLGDAKPWSDLHLWQATGRF